MDIFKFYNMNENLGRLIQYRDFKIKSWCNDVVDVWKKFINTNIKENGIIVEIGVQGGGSLLKTADLLIDRNIKLYGIDCWEQQKICGCNGHPDDFFSETSLNKLMKLQSENYNHLKKIIDHYDYKFMKLIKGFSNDKDIVNKFEDNSIDAIYIDGDHSYKGVKDDLELYYPKVKKNGLILCDDYKNFEGVKKAVDEFCNEKKINDSNKKGKIANKFYFYK